MAILLLFVALLVSFKRTQGLRKHSPFECGFLPKNVQRGSFSIQFFLIALIFLIFDVEVIILFPILIKIRFILERVIVLGLLVLILLGGLFLEWSQGSLEWRR